MNNRKPKYKPATKFIHYMAENEITYRKVAEITGYRPETVSNWVKGKTTFPYDAMYRISNYYKKTLDELFGNT